MSRPIGTASDRGSLVLIVGPDGAGKSSLATALEATSRSGFRIHRMHWRPELLPRLGAVVGKEAGDPSSPHARPPRSALFSSLALVYYWLDFFLGSWLRIRCLLRRGESVVMERGWYDFAVDPRRYRLSVSPAIVRSLGYLLPPPDVVLVLEAPADILLTRKAELEAAELSRQMQTWRAIRFPRSTIKVIVDASRPIDEIVRDARDVLRTSGSG